MPRISTFYGIVIALYFKGHDPPHFHALYSGQEMRVCIDTLDVLTGSLPGRARAMVLDWACLHQDELARAWENARAGFAPGKTDPLP